MIRPYMDADAPRLAAIHSQTYPQRKYTAASFQEFASSAMADGGHAWVAALPHPVGCAILSPLPGLPGIGELTGCVALDQRRQGFGTQLLLALLTGLRGTPFWQISHQLTDLDSPGAHFLCHHNFYIEHEEWQMELATLDQLPPIPTGSSLRLQTYTRPTAVSRFCRLYQQCFQGHPWDQPFTPTEVAATLKQARDILFLAHNGEPVGFVWVDLDSDGNALIEPLGIIPSYQRQGYGRLLLTLALHELKQRGAQRAGIGAWRSNQAAIHLYQSFGFRRKTTFTYLAYDLQSNPNSAAAPATD
jgi:ribosomal protein S18 acetylase RimI-like enzyme